MEFQLTYEQLNFLERALPRKFKLTNDTRATRSRTHSILNLKTDTIPIVNELFDKKTLQQDFNTKSGPRPRKASLTVSDDGKQSVGARSTRSARKRSANLFQSTKKSEWYDSCCRLLEEILEMDISAPFQYPVDTLYNMLPNYFDIIKHPMDLSTVEKKLKKRKYTSQLNFANDVRRTFSNAMTYNEEDSQVYEYAV